MMNVEQIFRVSKENVKNQVKPQVIEHSLFLFFFAIRQDFRAQPRPIFGLIKELTLNLEIIAPIIQADMIWW